MMSTRIALAAALATALAAQPAAAAPPVEPLELSIGSRWNLTVYGLRTHAAGRAAASANFALGAPAHAQNLFAPRALAAPTSRLTLTFNGGAASLTRGPEATPDYRHWFHLMPHASEWHLDGRRPEDERVARRRLRQAIAGLLRAAGGSEEVPSTFELGTDTAPHARSGFAPFPEGSGLSRTLGLNLVSIRLTSRGDGYLSLGKRIGRDAFLMLEPGLGDTRAQARLHYRLAPWIEMRVQAGRSNLIELVTVIPLE